MPANSPLNELPPSAGVGAPPADSRDPHLTPGDGHPAGGGSPLAGPPSAAERHDAERTERRRQRAAAHKAPTPRARRLKGSTTSTSVPTPARHMTVRDLVSISLIAVLVAGGVLGAILGALSAPGWVIGLLVAGLAVVLPAFLRRDSRLT